MDTSKDETHITVRIPAEVAEAMRRLAKQHDRSLNGEIVRAMREFIEKHQQGQEKQDKREN
jgi:predicted transcriptional regulator